MNLVARIKREIQANPAKAAALALLLVVAGYFWAPLVRGLIAPGEAPVTSEAASASAPAPTGVPTTVRNVDAVQPTVAESASYDWRKYAALIDEDAKMVPSAPLPSDRDPFASPQLTTPPEPATPAPSKVVAEPVSPADAGLVLTTTLLGTRMKIAEINGKSYRVDDRVKVLDDESNTSFRVVEIHPRRVILESRGNRYELKIARPLLDAVVESRDDEDETVRGDEPAEQKTGDGALQPNEPRTLTD